MIAARRSYREPSASESHRFGISAGQEMQGIVRQDTERLCDRMPAATGWSETYVELVMMQVVKW